MFKKIMIVLAVIIILIIIGIGILAYLLKTDAQRVPDFIKANPERAAILFIQNDTVFAQHQIHKKFPLASTVKIIIAIEYAEQAANGMIKPDEQVALSELDKLYIPNTDGGAHPAWLTAVKDKIHENKISIREIAKGMIRYSSNANTEWLLHRLGMKQVNGRLDSLGLKNHDQLYDIVSALFVSNIAFSDIPNKATATQLSQLSLEAYKAYAAQAHEQLMADTNFKKKLGTLSEEMQKVWSDRLPASTVSEYVSILQKINSRNYFSPSAQSYLDEVMEFLLENPKNKAWLAHCGSKGGSTMFVLTKTIYATDKRGNKTELAYFFNNLSTWESVRLEGSINAFELKVLQDKEFAHNLKKELYQE